MQKSKLLDGHLKDICTFFNTCREDEDFTEMTLKIRCTNKDANAVYKFIGENREDRFSVQINGIVESAEGRLDRLDIDMATKQALSVRAVDVIFNDPATIVFWSDGTKTVVKCQAGEGDIYNPEAGLAMCYMKKALGNSSRAFNNALKPAKDKEWEEANVPSGLDFLKQMAKMMQQPEREEQ